MSTFPLAVRARLARLPALDSPHHIGYLLLFSDLEAGASAWLYWNMILDQNGGPWLVSPIHGNPDPNVQHGVVIINRETKQVTYTGTYYYLAHFSKYVRPGAVRVETKGTRDRIRCLAFKNQNGQLVAQLMNRSDTNQTARLVFRGKTVALTLPAISITTCRWQP